MKQYDFLNKVNNINYAVLIPGLVDETGLVEGVLAMEVRGKTLMTSADELVLKALIESAKKTKDAEVIRRLTLADINAEVGQYYQSSKIVVTTDAKGRQHEMLVGRNGDNVAVRVILDAGIRSEARVLTVSLSCESGQWLVTSYAVTQYITSEEAITDGEPELFLVDDYVDGENDPCQACRDAVVEYVITGGKGETAWIKEVVKNSHTEDKDAAFDDAQMTLASRGEKFGRVLYATVKNIVNTVDEKFPQKQQERRPKHVSRPRYNDKFGSTLKDALAVVAINE